MAYTTIDDPSVYFQTAIYSGTGSTRNVTNDGNSDLQPDWIWIKSRDTTSNHNIFDSNRGVTKRLKPNSTDAEDTLTAFSHFLSDGFTITGAPLNDSGSTWVAWQWKANGGTTTTNDASSTSVGNQDSVYQANTTAGFSIVTWAGQNQVGTMAHGLGVIPTTMIIKARGGTEKWGVYHHKNTSAPATDQLILNATDATADTTTLMNDTLPTSSIFTVGDSGIANENDKTYVGYLFNEVKGFSKFGKYTGNGNNNGPFLYTGFKPAMFFRKRTNGANNWNIWDSKRAPFNEMHASSAINTTDVEDANTGYNDVDFCSNGIKIHDTGDSHNGNGYTYVYWAWAESPFVSSEGVPTTAR